MSGAVQTEVSIPNYLEMSDEEMLKASAPVSVPAEASETPAATPAAAAVTPEAASGSEEEDESAGAGTDVADVQAADGSEAAAGNDDAGAAAEEVTGKAGEISSDQNKGQTPITEKAAETDPKDKTPEATDYEAQVKKILAPFKANGREVRVESVDDAIALMQMGANYNKKMAALKPNLQLMKMLENNGLLSAEKLSFLIDLDKKNPDAINKLVKDAGINPLDLDGEKAGDYQPKTHAVDEREVELDTVLEELQESPSYNRLITAVAKEWDGNSKQAIAQEPQLLKVLNDHMARGIYDRISTEVERERMFGRLSGMSDLEAYRFVGDAIQARGGFNDLVDTPPESKPVPKPEVVVAPKPKVEDPKLNEKRRAAGSTKTVAPSTGLSGLNPLAMSDDEFAKLATPAYR